MRGDEELSKINSIKLDLFKEIQLYLSLKWNEGIHRYIYIQLFVDDFGHYFFFITSRVCFYRYFSASLTLISLGFVYPVLTVVYLLFPAVNRFLKNIVASELLFPSSDVDVLRFEEDEPLATLVLSLTDPATVVAALFIYF